MPEKAAHTSHTFIPTITKKMNKETQPAEAFRLYNRGIVLQMQVYIGNKDWSGLTTFIEALNTETETFIKSLLIENKTSSATAG